MKLNIQLFGGRGASSQYNYSSFSKSKIKTTLYHGTGRDFESFDITKSGETTGNNGDFGYGIYFTQNRELAQDYVRDKNNNYASEGNIYQVKINTQKPFYWSSIKTEEQFNQFKKDLGIKSDGIYWNRTNNEIHTMRDGKASKELTKKLKKAGYDAVVYRHDKNASEYVVFSSKQIRITKKEKYRRK